MFTVKWTVKHKQGDVTRMFQANAVTCAYRNYAPPNPNEAKREAPEKPWMVEDRQVDHALVILDGMSLADGVVYVMNESGATVAKYKLSDAIIDYQELEDMSRLKAA